MLVRGGVLVALTGDDYHNLVRSAPLRGIAGGRIYDAVIVACAVVANVHTILTFHESDFRRLVKPPLEVVVRG